MILRLLCLFFSLTAMAELPANWTEPFPPHKIAGNLYYVGSRDLASYLIATNEGHILINSSLEESVPLIKASVEQLGFKFTDVRILLISHAHSDHCAGSAEIIKLTGAKYAVMEPDVAAVEHGGTMKKGKLNRADYTQFPPVKVDRVLKDGDEVKLGGSSVVAHLTPGHTPGCTTWTMKVDGLNAVIIGSPNVNLGYMLVNNTTYPTIATDYETCFRVLKSLPCDLFLGAHGGYYDMEKKHAKLKAGATNPFVDPEGYRRYVAEKEQAFLNEWQRQKSK